MSWPWKFALSLAWGLLLAGGVAYWVGATLLGFAWIYLYGDNPWPDYVDAVFLVGAAAAAILAFGGVAAAIVFLPRISPSSDLRLQASAVLRWILLAVPLLIMAGAIWGLERGAAESERSFAAHQAIEQRRAAAHRLVSAEWRLDPVSGRLSIELAADGGAGGSYTLSWEVTGGGRGPLGSGTMSQELPAGPASLTVDLDAADLARRYARAILNRNVETGIQVSLEVDLALALNGLPAGWEEPLRIRPSLDYDYSPDGTITFRPSS